MRFLLSGLTTAAFLLASCQPQSGADPAPIQPDAFNQLARQFTADYAELNIPPLDISFIANLESLGGKEALIAQKETFQSYKSQLAKLSAAELDVCRKIDLSIMRTETDFGLQRAELGLAFLELDVNLDEITHLAGMPMGGEWYAYFLDKWNSARLDPDEIYAFGEAELSQAVARYDVLQARLGFEGDDDGLARHLSSAGFLDGDAHTLALFKEKQARVRANLDRLFTDDHDVEPAIIRRSDRGTTMPVTGYYQVAEGTFYYNLLTEKFEARQADWLFLHEGTPGHHFQMTAERAGTLCDSLMPEIFHGAYIEGWAAYSETLGDVLGLYDTDEARLAAVEWDMVRSVRVVLDVAINAYGWSDEEALAYWQDNVRGQEDIARREIARIRRWPAQVVTYKYGADVFESVRAAHRDYAAPGAATKAFHDTAIAYGSMPLATFENLFTELTEFQRLRASAGK